MLRNVGAHANIGVVAGVALGQRALFPFFPDLIGGQRKRLTRLVPTCGIHAGRARGCCRPWFCPSPWRDAPSAIAHGPSAPYALDTPCCGCDARPWSHCHALRTRCGKVKPASPTFNASTHADDVSRALKGFRASSRGVDGRRGAAGQDPSGHSPRRREHTAILARSAALCLPSACGPPGGAARKEQPAREAGSRPPHRRATSSQQ